MYASRLRKAIGLACSSAAAFSLIWLFVPPPLYVLWLLGVGATEWSLWFGLLGLVGGILSVLPLRAGQRSSYRNWSRTDSTAAFLGLFAIFVSLVPLIRALLAAWNAGDKSDFPSGTDGWRREGLSSISSIVCALSRTGENLSGMSKPP